MIKIPTIFFAGALAIGAISFAGAETTHLSLSSLAKLGAVKAPATNSAAPQAAPNGNSLFPYTVHAGAMVTPRGAGLAGADIDIPSVSILKGFTGRLDVDVIFKANFGGVRTLTIITLDQISTTQNGLQGHNVYYGGGLGAIMGGEIGRAHV